MPSIKITEVNNTSSGTAIVAEDVVFVPGFVNKDYISDTKAVDAYIPTLCTTVAQFEQYFGPIPAAFASAQAWPNSFPSEAKGTDAMFAAGELDPGYVYAKELLNAGLPVIYERMNTSDADIIVDQMYTQLYASSIWSDLTDVGEYSELKYLTTGGYPVFEWYMQPDPVYTTTVDGVTFSAATFKTKTADETGLVSYKWIYGRRDVELADGTVATEGDLPDAGAAYLDKIYFISDTQILKKCIGTVVSETETTYKWEDYPFQWWKYHGTDTPITEELTSYGWTIPTAAAVVLDSTLTVTHNRVSTSSIVNKMLESAASRGDCIALIDHTNMPGRSLVPTETTSVYYSVSSADSDYHITTNGEFATMFTPWCATPFVTTLQTTDTLTTTQLPPAMPASFVYLKALAASIKTNANWLAIAGAARGAVDITKPYLYSSNRLSNAIADSYQPRTGTAINAITTIKPYGYLIWGNRTLMYNAENLTAPSFLNTRNMISDIKKVAYRAAKKCMFEQNSDILWLNYKALLTPSLSQLVSGGGISSYKLIKEDTDQKGELKCTIRIYPLYAVESFDITVELADEEVTVS